MTDEELIEELCLAVGEIRDQYEKRIAYITERRDVLLAKGEVIEDAEQVERVLAGHRKGIACCDRWYEKNGVTE